jgi:hypothetical protein
VDYESLPKYSSADEDNYFGWRNMNPKTPVILATRFILEFPTFAEQGHHPDPAYGDWEPPLDRILTEFCEDGVVVPLPPVWKNMEKKKAKTSSNINDTNRLVSS